MTKKSVVSFSCSETFLSYVRVWREALDAINPSPPCRSDTETEGDRFEGWLSTNCKNESNRTRLVYRCRYWVRQDISRFRWDSFVEGMRCPVTWKILDYSTCHVDHVYPNTFVNIFNSFIDEFSINVEGLDFVNRKTIQDAGILRDWVDFHNEFACLSIVSPEANTSFIPKYINSLGLDEDILAPGQIKVSEFYDKVKNYSLNLLAQV